MRILILNTDYAEFLDSLYADDPALEHATYEEQLRRRRESLFGVADFYSRNLCALGHDAHEIYVNNEPLQRAWARERGRARVSQNRTLLVRGWRKLSGAGSDPEPAWTWEVLRAQIEDFRPDVVLNQAPLEIPFGLLPGLKAAGFIGILALQHAAGPIDPGPFSPYDLVISSFPPTITTFTESGIRAHLNRLAFEASVLSALPRDSRDLDVTFVGGFHELHSSRIRFLEELCGLVPQLRIWGSGIGRLRRDSPLRDHYVGTAWGREMYSILGRSLIVLNHHGDVPAHANNMRLYEATGMGALLLTDWKSDLGEMFVVGQEVAAYTTAEDCAEQICWYLAHAEDRERVARAGQQRTLRDHTYSGRMQAFQELLATVG